MLLVCLLNSEQKQAHSIFHSVRQIWLYYTHIRNSEPARGGGGWKHTPAEKLYFSRKQRIGCSQLARWCSLAGRKNIVKWDR